MRRFIPQGLWTGESLSGNKGRSVTMSSDTQGRSTAHGRSGQQHSSLTLAHLYRAGKSGALYSVSGEAQ